LVTTGAVLVDLAMGAFIPIWSLILAVLIANALLFPPCYRFSRSLMLHFFGSIVYDPKAIEEAPRIFVAADGHMQVLDGDDDLP
jgi:hypothetical protein